MKPFALLSAPLLCAFAADGGYDDPRVAWGVAQATAALEQAGLRAAQVSVVVTPETAAGPAGRRVNLSPEKDIVVPVLSAAKPDIPHGAAVLIISPRGKLLTIDSFFAQRMLSKGLRVCAADLRGAGELALLAAACIPEIDRVIAEAPIDSCRSLINHKERRPASVYLPGVCAISTFPK